MPSSSLIADLLSAQILSPYATTDEESLVLEVEGGTKEAIRLLRMIGERYRERRGINL